MIKLTIDGKAVEIEKGATILAAAEKAGITIPTLCFLKKVSPTGACRVCVVDIEGVEKPMAACHTQAVDGMVVTTQSERLHAIRKQIVELLLVNHPLDCPVCDAGGECQLQDITYAFNVIRQSFEAEDVNPDTIDRWPLIQQVPNRCVMCEKCVKVCHEVIGSSALFVNDKGDRAFIDKKLELCEFCGNCVQVCPTGTMISKTFKFKARPWELRRTASVCTLCSAQCEIDLHSKRGEVCRVTSEDGVTVNDGNLCIGGFFGYGFINSERRLMAPRARSGNEFRTLDWDEAVALMVDKARAAGGAASAGLGSARLTNEENYLFQKLFRVGLSSNNIDSEARFGYLRGVEILRRQLGLGGASNRIDRIGRSQAVLVFGADVTTEAPAIDWQIELACRKRDGKLVLANMRQVKLSRHANVQLAYRPGSEVELAQALIRLIVERGLADRDYLNQYLQAPEELESLVAAIDLEQAISATGVSRELLEEAAEYLGSAESVAIVFGADVLKGLNAEAATGALADLALVSGALRGDIGGLFPVDEKGNIQGVIDMGVAPELLPGQKDYAAARSEFEKAWKTSLPEGGRDAAGILAGIESGEIRFLYLAGVNPLVAFPEAGRWRRALEKVDFLAVQDILASELTEMADLVLPAASFAEKSGSVTSIDGRVGYLQPAIGAPGEARPDGWIFAALLGALTGQAAPSESVLQQEIRQLCGIHEDVCFAGNGRKSCLKLPWRPENRSLKLARGAGAAPGEGPLLLVGKHLAHFGTTTTAAAGPCQVVAEGFVEVNPDDLKTFGLSEGGAVTLTTALGAVKSRVRVNAGLPQGLLFAPYHFADTPVMQLVPAGSNCVPVQVSRG
ncbi:formate dehydrogenase alpha subunit [Geothermobacter ehrlichii]|uniref:Formate dehydrogenase alpha subunit n=1 Tax=Geothermobacter ehrlichii TaxID=213224 RepID=A0A5D3WPC3_9BACT|nr:molybdopterin-dependent oxidoreductase [Geothermobacter ehrlichii]TYO99258.1 formate dehydrogenase alpha subunit [Geothermobacter ehrlichii]